MSTSSSNSGFKIRRHPQAALAGGLLVGVLAALCGLFGHVTSQVIEVLDLYPGGRGDPWSVALQLLHRLSFGEAWRDLGEFAVAGGLLIGGVAGAAIWKSTPRTEPFNQPIPSDPQIFHDRLAETQLHAAFKKDGGTIDGQPLYIAPHVPIPGSTDLKNFLLCGIAGSGKTNIIRPIISQVIARGDMVVLHCSKGDVSRSFRTEDIILVSPTHRDGWAWNMAEDITSRADVEEFAAMVIPQSDQPFFSDTARLVFQDIIVSVAQEFPGKWNARVLLERVLATPDEIIESIKHMDLSAAPLITTSDPEGASRTVESIMATLISGAMKTLKPMAFAWTATQKERIFSVRSVFSAGWKGPRVLIVQSDPNYKVLSENLCGGLIRRICAHVTSPSIDMQGRRVTMVLDEFKSLGRVEDFARTLSVAREKKLMMVIALQSRHQLDNLYGKEAREILDLLQIKIYGRQGDGNSAKEISEALGKREINVTVPNLLPSDKDTRSRVAKNRQLPLFSQKQLEGELGNFYPATPAEVIAGLVTYAGNAYRIDWPPTKWRTQSEGYVPAKWTQIARLPTK